MNFQDEYSRLRDRIEEYLRNAVPEDVPQPLGDAMRYSLLAGGKRLRAVLLLAAYSLLKDDIETALPFAAAVEMVHTYSLIHDDLPAMDNDDLRRGKPTCHKVYGDGMAVLAGDGLLSLAFESIAASEHPKALLLVKELADRCGTRGMVAGQCADLEAEKGGGSEKLLHYIHLHKTADMITAPMVMGLTLAGASDEQIACGREYGKDLGIAFQIVDDILDVTGDTAVLGKTIGKDAEENKCTWVSVYGIDQARQDASSHTENAVKNLDIFGDKAIFLKTLAQHTLMRVK